MLPNLKKSSLLWIQVPFYLVSLLYTTMRCVRRESIDLIHAHWVIPQGIVARMVQSFTGRPTVVTIHGGDVFAFRGKMARWIKRFALSRVAACTANSAYTRLQIMNALDRIPVRVVPMGVDLTAFPSARDTSVRAELRISGEMVLFVGRLVQKKGVHDLLAAMHYVLERFPETTLVVIGDGSQRKKLEDLASKLGIARSVRFLGKLPHAQLPRFYATADLFVGPSVVDGSGDTEGLGVVFLEAAAAGLAMIGTSVGGIADILIHDATGLIVEPGSPMELADAISRLLKDSGLRLRLGAAARSRVLQQFSWTYVAKEFSNLFEGILHRNCADVSSSQ
jgi:glycosyltransferase involved in cell wall biosynthesis